MSYDLLVATRTRPAAGALDAFARTAGIELRVAGGFGSGSNALLIRAGAGAARTIDVDGPARIKPEDLPDDLAGAIKRPAWLIEIHLPGGFDGATDRWTLDLAIHLARAGDGAVFDPQADRLVWPSGVTPRPRGAPEERIRTVELVWYLPASLLPPDAAGRYLDLAAERFSAAKPARFGAFEPLQGSLVRDGDEGFIAAWQAQADSELGGTLFWSARSPGVDGSVSFADPRADRRPARLGRAVRLSTTFDARPLHRDPRTGDAAVEFFADVAAELGAVYAAGCVLRDAILRRGRISYDSRSEVAPLPRSRWWVGLPARPTWLAWFGDPYRALIADALDGSNTTVRRSGLLVRCGEEPTDVDELGAVFPRLPAELLAVRRAGSTADPLARITLTNGPPSEPAAIIPAID